MKIYTFIFALIMSVNSVAQVDELLKKYPQQSGKEKIYTLLDICFYYSQNNPREGKKFGRQAYRESLPLNDSKLISDCLNDWSICFMTIGDLDSALLLLDQSLQIRRKIGDPLLIAKTQSKRGTVLFEKGHLDQSLVAFVEALKIFQDNKLIPFSALTKANIGNVYEKLGQTDKAENAYLDLLNISRAHQIKNYEFTALGALAKIKSKQGLWNEANAYFIAGEKIIGSDLEPSTIGIFYQNFGINYRHLKESSKALSMLKKALEIYQKIPDELSIAYTTLNLANVYLDLRKIDEARKFADSGYEQAKKLGAFNTLKYAYKTMARYAYLNNNDQLGDEYIEKFESYKDSINNAESQKNIDRLMIEFHTAEKEKALLETQLKNDKYLILLALSLLMIAVLFIIAIIKIQKNKINQKKIELDNQRKLNHERIRISRDLHDHLGAEITYIAAKLDILSNELNSNTLIPQLANNARSAGQMMRETIWSIKNEQITTHDLFSKIKEYSEKTKQGLNLDIHVKFSNEEIKISPGQALGAFRIVQECVQNAIKHSQCSNISIEISSSKISVKDNGKGLPHDVSGGNGMINMKERASENGMKFDLNSGSIGTEIAIIFS